VPVALRGELAAERVDVGLLGVALAHVAERGGEVDLRAVQQSEVVREVHQTRSTFTAATLKSGWRDTGSHAVIVSSFAARRDEPFSPASQYP
jgi:hypothetical protein